MAQLGQAFDPATAPESDRNFDVMPAGWHPMHAIEADVQPPKTGGGQMICLTWEVLDGAFKGRRIWHRINYINASAQAQEIGQRELGQLCKALGLGPITDTDVLKFKPVQGRVGIEKGKDGYEDKNKVSDFKPYGQSGAAPPPQQPARFPAPAQAAAASGGQATVGGARPWVNK